MHKTSSSSSPTMVIVSGKNTAGESCLILTILILAYIKVSLTYNARILQNDLGGRSHLGLPSTGTAAQVRSCKRQGSIEASSQRPPAFQAPSGCHIAIGLVATYLLAPTIPFFEVPIVQLAWVPSKGDMV